MVKYPVSVSRTLPAEGRSLKTVVSLHDHHITDADINLIQDIQDFKRKQLLNNTTGSGCLTYQPFQFTPNVVNSFLIPAFDVLMNGETLHIAGSRSADLTQNCVVVPAPAYWTVGSGTDPNAVYIVYVEAWYARLDPESGAGYSVDTASGVRGIYPFGCIDALRSNMLTDDVGDPFDDENTTERVQIQWSLRVQAVAPTYDFTGKVGLEPGSLSTEKVYAQTSQVAPQINAIFNFTNMLTINGDPGLWRAGDGLIGNDLATLDGYSYAIPVAIVHQRNTGVFSTTTNPFGCAAPAVVGSGVLASGISGRFDGKLADVIVTGDVIDTRSTISLAGVDEERLLREGFANIITSTTRSAIKRGVTPGGQATQVGSTLGYTVAVASTSQVGVDTISSFDGYRSAFRSDTAISTVTKAISVNAKSVGTVGSRWVKGDVCQLSIPNNDSAAIVSVQVQGLYSDTVNSAKNAINLLEGQIDIAGIGSNTITVTILKNLQGTSFDPGTDPLYLTLEIQYAADSGDDLRFVPDKVYGGVLTDTASGTTLPVFAVSQFDTRSQQPSNNAARAVWATNPTYSHLIFGTRAWINVAGNSGTQITATSGSKSTTFTIPRTGLASTLTGAYVVRAWDAATGSNYTITSRIINGNQFTFTVSGVVDITSTMVVSFLCVNTSQLLYNSAVKGISSLEESVFVGNVQNLAGFSMDKRVTVASVKYTQSVSNVITLVSSDATLRAISGDDVNKLLWVYQSNGTFLPMQIGDVQISGGMATVTLPPTVDLTSAQFFMVAAINPALPASSTLFLGYDYVPYQGEGIAGRDYEMIKVETEAYVTTNGTGAAPIPGLRDVYPFDRRVPIITQLPSRSEWSDASLANGIVATLFDSNYEAKRAENVEHTLTVPLHTNDFIAPLNGDMSKTIRMVTAGGNRGFVIASPHVGFAVETLEQSRSLSTGLAATVGAITLYVDNVKGLDTNDGLTTGHAFKTVGAACASLPPVLRHPCTINLMATGTNYNIADIKTSLVNITLGDGDVRTQTYYALANISHSVQDSGCLTFVGLGTSPVIDATSFSGFGEGSTCAFFVNDSRVIFRNLTFTGFQNMAIKAIDGDVEMIDCTFAGNLLAGSFEQSTAVMDRGTLSIGDGAVGFAFTQSNVDVNACQFTVSDGTPTAFFQSRQQSSLTFHTHSPALETGVTGSTVIAKALLNSSVVTDADFTSSGSAVIQMNSVLARTVSATPFAGGITTDASSNTTSLL